MHPSTQNITYSIEIYIHSYTYISHMYVKNIKLIIIKVYQVADALNLSSPTARLPTDPHAFYLSFSFLSCKAGQVECEWAYGKSYKFSMKKTITLPMILLSIHPSIHPSLIYL